MNRKMHRLCTDVQCVCVYLHHLGIVRMASSHSAVTSKYRGSRPASTLWTRGINFYVMVSSETCR